WGRRVGLGGRSGGRRAQRVPGGDARSRHIDRHVAIAGAARVVAEASHRVGAFGTIQVVRERGGQGATPQGAVAVQVLDRPEGISGTNIVERGTTPRQGDLLYVGSLLHVGHIRIADRVVHLGNSVDQIRGRGLFADNGTARAVARPRGTTRIRRGRGLAYGRTRSAEHIALERMPSAGRHSPTDHPDCGNILRTACYLTPPG